MTEPAHEAYVRASITQMLLRAASRAGVSRGELIDAAGVDERLLDDAEGKVPIAMHRRIGIAVLQRVPAELLPELVSQVVSTSTFGVVGKVAQNCETVHDALAAMIRYQRLVVDGSELTLERKRSTVVFTTRLPRPIEQLRQPVFAIFAVIIALSEQLAGHEMRPTSVTFAFTPLHGEARRFSELFGVTPKFSAKRHTMTFAASLLATPVVGARGDHHALLSSYADALLADLGPTMAVTSEVSRVLVTHLPRGISRQEAIARELGMSARTLSRRLKAEKTTYGQVLEAARRELSQRYLSDASLTVQEVTFLLGYSEPSTFFRAFKRWTGQTPRGWRLAR